ncbi:MAG TPA: cytochrome c family protein [Nannocystaceae bacterium]|nr:cytochrome c family protein [Nannocystaceae bacterium]
MKRTTLLVLALAGCKDDAKSDGPREELLDAKACEECHPQHYQQWLGSMHAYASDDPVFLAMNARGQRETGGEMGDLCVRCHAPMALALGLTTDGLNLDEVPPHLKGVTCYFCHNVESIDGTHNNPLLLAMDDVFRGEIDDAVENDFHRTDYAAELDGETVASGDMCGSCHDIVNGHGTAIERTYQEWTASFYSDPAAVNPLLVEYYGQSCNDCHMRGSKEPIADFPGVQTRNLRDHRFVGVDLALTDWPDAERGPALLEDQRAHAQEFMDPEVCVGLCVNPVDGGGTEIELWLHNEFAGHHFPSGAAQDRRLWVELEGFAGDTSVLSTGVVAADESIDAAAIADPTLWVLRDFAYGLDDEPVKMFWEIARVEENTLAVAAEAGLVYDKTTWKNRKWVVDGPVDRATVKLNLRPIPFELVDELAEDGLDPAVKARIPTFTLAQTVREWTPDTATMTDLEGLCVQSATCFEAISMDDGL